jgi:hypothetical protein
MEARTQTEAFPDISRRKPNDSDARWAGWNRYVDMSEYQRSSNLRTIVSDSADARFPDTARSKPATRRSRVK